MVYLSNLPKVKDCPAYTNLHVQVLLYSNISTSTNLPEVKDCHGNEEKTEKVLVSKFIVVVGLPSLFIHASFVYIDTM
jgi:dihydrodipicolinate synthase/N-acetylneuraminate lyase